MALGTRTWVFLFCLWLSKKHNIFREFCLITFFFLCSLLNNAFEELVAFQKALKDFVASIDATYAKQYEEFYIGLEGSFGSKHVSPRTLTSCFLSCVVCVEGIVTKCESISMEGFLRKWMRDRYRNAYGEAQVELYSIVCSFRKVEFWTCGMVKSQRRSPSVCCESGDYELIHNGSWMMSFAQGGGVLDHGYLILMLNSSYFSNWIS